MNTPKRILLVEDDSDIRGIIAAFLSSARYDVVETDNVSTALQNLSNHKPFDLAIVDFWLGKVHAVSIIDAMKTNGYSVPIIIISGGSQSLALESTEAIADISGAVAFLQKPFEKSTLLGVVASAMEG